MKEETRNKVAFWVGIASLGFSVVSLLKGWITMKELIDFWDNLNPWKVWFYVALIIFIINGVLYIIRKTKEISKKFHEIEKQAFHHDHAIENIQGLKEKIKAFEKEPSNRISALNQLIEEIEGHKKNKQVHRPEPAYDGGRLLDIKP